MIESPHIFVLNRIRTLGKTTKRTALEVNLCEKSLRVKSKDPDLFSVGELKRVFDALAFTSEEKKDYLRKIGIDI